MTIDGKAGRTVASLTRLERKWCRTHYCGWCEQSLMASKCGSMLDPVRCDMDEQRARALQQYKPRAHLGDTA